MNKDSIYNRIVKKLTDEISEEDEQLLEQELADDFSVNRGYKQLFTFWKYYFPKKQKHSIVEKTEAKLGFKPERTTVKRNYTWLKVAAGILLLISVGYTSYDILKPKEQIELNEYSCGPNQVRVIKLSDGSKVWLNANSLLMANEPFNGKTRTVKLFGEAYFEVFKKPEQPFVVESHELKTQVIGTHFNVVAYPTDDVHEVELYEGKVQISSDKFHTDKYILNPGDKAYFSHHTGKIIVKHTDLGTPAQWRDGVLRFYDEDLFSIARKLERKYRTKIFIADSIVGKYRYTAEFEEETLSRILEVLSQAKTFDYDVSNNGVLIQHKN